MVALEPTTRTVHTLPYAPRIRENVAEMSRLINAALVDEFFAANYSPNQLLLLKMATMEKISAYHHSNPSLCPPSRRSRSPISPSVGQSSPTTWSQPQIIWMW